MDAVAFPQLLTELDEFLRSSDLTADDLTWFLAHRGRRHPGYDARTLIDELFFTAHHLRRLADGVDKKAAAYAHLADYFGDEYRQHP